VAAGSLRQDDLLGESAFGTKQTKVTRRYNVRL